MDIRSLELFLSLSETLHFGRTSDAMHVSPSALTRHIQRLEDALGARLLARDNRTVKLTAAGENARRRFQTIVREWRQLETEVSSKNELSGTLHLYCSVTAAYTVMKSVIEKFRPSFPGVMLGITTGDSALAVSKVREGKADIAVASMPDSLPDNVIFDEFMRSPLVFIRPTMSCDVRQLTADNYIEWGELPLIAPEVGLSRERLLSWYRKQNLTPSIYAEVAGHEAIVAMVALGLGIGLVPKVVLEQSPMQDQIEIFYSTPDIKEFIIGLCCLKRQLQEPIVSAFWEKAKQL